MKCQQTEKYLLEYIEGNLPPGVQQEISAHLPVCPECTRLVARTRELWGGLGQVEIHPVPAQFFVNVSRKIAQLNQVVPRTLRLQTLLIPTFASGIVLVGLFIGNFLGSSLWQNISATDSNVTTYAEYLGLDYWEGSETDLLTDFNQGLQALDENISNQ